MNDVKSTTESVFNIGKEEFMKKISADIMTENELKNVAEIKLKPKIEKLQIIDAFFGAVSIVLSIILVITFFANFNDILGDNISKERTRVLILMLFLTIVCIFIWSYSNILKNNLIKKQVYDYKETFKYNQINQELNENNFEILSNINIEHLNKYYKQTYDQCDKSFSIAKMASNASYVILASGIILFFVSTVLLKEEQSRLIMFGITTGAGIIIKIVSSLYFYIYNKSVSKLSEYHDKLYTIQNILISLELSNQIENSEKKDDIKADMIKRLLEIHEKD